MSKGKIFTNYYFYKDKKLSTNEIKEAVKETLSLDNYGELVKTISAKTD